MGSDANEGVPENLRDFVDAIGIVLPPDDAPQPMKDLVELMLNGYCVSCKAPLEESTCFMVDSEGIHLVWCSAVCMTDFFNAHYLEEKHDEIQQALMFRGQRARADSTGVDEEVQDDDPRLEGEEDGETPPTG